MSLAPHVCVVVDLVSFSEMTQNNSFFTHALTFTVVPLFLLPGAAAAPPFVLCSDDGQLGSPLEALWGPLWWQLPERLFGRKCEQEAHASEYSGQESESRWQDSNSWSWDAQDLSDKEIFARMTHESSDESEAHADLIGLRSP